MNRFLEICHERGITTFLVTNGTNPDALRALNPLPTQLYVSVTAPNEEVFRRLTLPAYDDAWARLRESLEIVRGLNTRRVVRHTLVKGWNLGWVDSYAELDLLARPDFVEPKGYVYMGKSRQRLGRDHVPTHEEIGEFARRLSERTGVSPARRVARVEGLPARTPCRGKVSAGTNPGGGTPPEGGCAGPAQMSRQLRISTKTAATIPIPSTMYGLIFSERVSSMS